VAEETKAANYDASQIQVLEGLEAVRRRPGMYIGSTDIRGLHHLVTEVVDNGNGDVVGAYCSMADINGYPAVAYYDADVTTLKYAPNVENVVVIMPNVIPHQKVRVLVLRRQDARTFLDHPLSSILPGKSTRLSALDAWNASAAAEHGLQKTTSWTFEKPLRLHFARIFDGRE